jgi:hypothetical protein
VFILEELKVTCFHTLLQVLILGNLLAVNCTKIVQISGVIYKCGKTKALSATDGFREQKRQRGAGATSTRRNYIWDNYTSRVMNCQEKKWRKTERNGSQLLDSIGDLDWVAECCATTMVSQRYPELE